jgi:uncharacterized membrane protein (UPF0127 family)
MNNGIVTINGTAWNVKLATTAGDITAGFSNAQSTPAQTGILFEFAQPANGFVVNMQDMQFPLDIAFIGVNGTILGIARNVQPLNDVVDTVDAVSFLEVNAGELAAVNVGDIAVLSSSKGAINLDVASIIGLAVVVALIATMGISNTGRKRL